MGSGVAVDLENITIRFGDFTAVKDANVSINGGDFFSFLGPSGCGKTTILRAVSGFLEPSEGRVLIGGNDMAGIGPNKRPTALIFQNLALFPLMKVWENIAFSMEVSGASSSERRKRADELLDMIALGGQGEKLPSELSGGQKQRVAIARAVCEPRRSALGRAVVSARSETAPTHAHRAARNSKTRRHYVYLHHTRSGRGVDDVRQCRSYEGWSD